MSRNVIERIFGVVKKRWAILTRPPHFSMKIQARIPPALAALHNFILDHDDTDLEDFADVFDETPGLARDQEEEEAARRDVGTLSDHRTTEREKALAAAKRDEIAQAMWEDYQRELHERGQFDPNVGLE